MLQVKSSTICLLAAVSLWLSVRSCSLYFISTRCLVIPSRRMHILVGQNWVERNQRVFQDKYLMSLERYKFARLFYSWCKIHVWFDVLLFSLISFILYTFGWLFCILNSSILISVSLFSEHLSLFIINETFVFFKLNISPSQIQFQFWCSISVVLKTKSCNSKGSPRCWFGAWSYNGNYYCYTWTSCFA